MYTKVLKFSLRRKERLVAQLENRLAKQRDSRRALAEDNATYEARLVNLLLRIIIFESNQVYIYILLSYLVQVQLQEDMDEALEKETMRRKDAERGLQQLRKRIVAIEKKLNLKRKKKGGDGSKKKNNNKRASSKAGNKARDAKSKEKKNGNWSSLFV